MEEKMGLKEDRIRQRAYEIWEREGRPQGEDMKHWLQAFQEIAASAEADGQAVKKSRGKKPAALDAPAKTKAKPKTGSGAQSVPTTTPPPKPAKTPRAATRH
jgi:hypothetical protein